MINGGNPFILEPIIRRRVMFKTKNDLPEATRAKVVELLNARLADCIDLQTQTKQAHWNVKGPNFIALHELFDKINEEVEDYVDDIAERAVQLGGVAEGTARLVAERSSLSEYPSKAVRDAARHIRDVLGEWGLESFPMVTGGKGIHVIAPLKPVTEWPLVKLFCRTFAQKLEDTEPEHFTANIRKVERKGRMFVDYLRNERGSTAVAPFSTRGHVLMSDMGSAGGSVWQVALKAFAGLFFGSVALGVIYSALSSFVLARQRADD